MTEVYVELVHPNAKIPTKATEGSAGHDLYAIEKVTLERGKPKSIKTGIKIRLPPGTYGRIADRSGMVKNHSIITRAGVIDGDFGGQLEVLMISANPLPYEVSVGDRVAQIIIEKYCDDAKFIDITGKIPRTLLNHFQCERNARRSDDDDDFHQIMSGEILLTPDGPIYSDFTPEMMRLLSLRGNRGFGSSGR